MALNNVTIVGLGYIGLPTAAIISSEGINTAGVDVNEEIVHLVNKGEIHIEEPGLGEIIEKSVKKGSLRAMRKPQISDVFVIAVPTPFDELTKTDNFPSPDISYVKDAVESIAPVVKGGDLIILESTSPVGTTEKIRDWLEQLRPDMKFPKDDNSESDINIAYCPERVLPGNALQELVENDRVIGGVTKRCSEAAAKFYKLFIKGECIITDSKTAELTKLTENAFRDVNIAFANELSLICDDLGLNVWNLIKMCNQHPRVNILEPGPGVGGHCIAVDPWFIVSSSPKYSKLIQEARRINDSKPLWVIKKIKEMIDQFLKINPKQNITDVNIVFYGLSFKPDIGDLRESPALKIALEVCNFHPGNVFCVEPFINSDHKMIQNLKLIDQKEALSIGNIHILLVNHSQFYHLNFKSNFLLDTKGIF